ncbi:MAG: hypothetical protein B6U76_05210 [Desulfurococcales archaeon ex4484_217_2]|nr:MAG: hypothetical protein B6U76_05210 [Desulfurococcales archaeon ex4484_217_2]
MKALIVKEFKDLMRDPRIWIPFIISAIILPIMGLVISIPMKQAVEEAVREYVHVGVVVLDEGDEAYRMLEYFNENKDQFKIVIHELSIPNLEFKPIEESFVRRIVEAVEENGLENIGMVLVIPPDFSEKVAKRERVTLGIVMIVREISFFGGFKSYRITGLIDRYLGERYLEGTNITLSLVTSPSVSYSSSYIASKNIVIFGEPSAVLTSLGFASFFIPIILMVVTVSVMQMSATSMAVENEEKTLETLLTFPISRTQILLAKLLGSFAVSVIGSALNVAGFIAYMQIMSSPGTQMGMTGMNVLISTIDLVYILVSMIATIFFTATLGLVIGALSSDVRIAGTITGPLSMGIFIPGYFIAFMDISKFDYLTRTIFYALPLTQPIIMIKQAVVSSLPLETPIYLATSIAISFLIIVITARIFSLETLSNLQRKLMRLKRK